MINLMVDECYAFDYLSILYIKQNKYPSSDKIETYDKCYRLLSEQINNFNEIINSIEYQQLITSNEYTFELIDKLRKNEHVSAKELDSANMDRFYKKNNLQQKFFPDSTITETKIL